MRSERKTILIISSQICWILIKFTWITCKCHHCQIQSLQLFIIWNIHKDCWNIQLQLSSQFSTSFHFYWLFCVFPIQINSIQFECWRGWKWNISFKLVRIKYFFMKKILSLPPITIFEEFSWINNVELSVMSKFSVMFTSDKILMELQMGIEILPMMLQMN